MVPYTSTATKVQPSIGLPLYIYPTPAAWAPLHTAISTNPGTLFRLIVNPANGPGGPVPDANYIAQITALHAFPNVQIFGYIHTSWGTRALSAIKADVATYEAWNKYAGSAVGDAGNVDISIDGIFLDETPSAPEWLDYMRQLPSHIKSILSGSAIVWSNPGVVVDARFYGVVDLVNAFENSWTVWKGQEGRESVLRGVPKGIRDKATVMMHGYVESGSRGRGKGSEVEGDVQELLDYGFAAVLLTGSASYTAFCPAWSRFVEAVSGSGVFIQFKCWLGFVVWNEERIVEFTESRVGRNPTINNITSRLTTHTDRVLCLFLSLPGIVEQCSPSDFESSAQHRKRTMTGPICPRPRYMSKMEIEDSASFNFHHRSGR